VRKVGQRKNRNSKALRDGEYCKIAGVWGRRFWDLCSLTARDVTIKYYRGHHYMFSLHFIANLIFDQELRTFIWRENLNFKGIKNRIDIVYDNYVSHPVKSKCLIDCWHARHWRELYFSIRIFGDIGDLTDPWQKIHRLCMGQMITITLSSAVTLIRSHS
jgi:hypothetical protein